MLLFQIKYLYQFTLNLFLIYIANISVYHYNLVACHHAKCRTPSILGMITLALQNTYVIPRIIFSIHSLVKTHWYQVSLKQLT